MPTDIAELKGLLERATAGPWRVGDNGEVYAEPESDSICMVLERTFVGGNANAALIVALVNAAPSLLSECEELRGENERLKRELQNLMWSHADSGAS